MRKRERKEQSTGFQAFSGIWVQHLKGSSRPRPQGRRGTASGRRILLLSFLAGGQSRTQAGCGGRLSKHQEEAKVAGHRSGHFSLQRTPSLLPILRWLWLCVQGWETFQENNQTAIKRPIARGLVIIQRTGLCPLGSGKRLWNVAGTNHRPLWFPSCL